MGGQLHAGAFPVFIIVVECSLVGKVDGTLCDVQHREWMRTRGVLQLASRCGFDQSTTDEDARTVKTRHGDGCTYSLCLLTTIGFVKKYNRLMTTAKLNFVFALTGSH